jgi:HD-GYP domain-containing protein (c-di-GMP phosphodiesterase class II)
VLEKLKKFYPEDKIRINAVSHHHERIDGTGYPDMMKGADSIDEYARIIAVVDAYDALTHSRLHRKEMTPWGALSTIMTMEIGKYDMSLLRVLSQEMRFYFPETIVRLSSGEIAKVVAINEELPSRPKVKLLMDREQKKASQEIIDLSKSTSLRIEEIIDT